MVAAGLEWVAPKTWAEMGTMAKGIKDGAGMAGIGIAGKDFDWKRGRLTNRCRRPPSSWPT